MPTNLVRNRSARPQVSSRGGQPTGSRVVAVDVGRVSLRIGLLATPSAERLWMALPLFSVAETWGDSIHFGLPVECGRERGARLNGEIGQVYYWGEDNRLIIPFGPTPISRPGEMRLPRPCNVLAVTEDDVRALRVVTPGEKVSLHRAPDRGGRR
jgi:hypothetical protein